MSTIIIYFLQQSGGGGGWVDRESSPIVETMQLSLNLDCFFFISLLFYMDQGMIFQEVHLRQFNSLVWSTEGGKDQMGTKSFFVGW
jgi:hypothetical protein